MVTIVAQKYVVGKAEGGKGKAVRAYIGLNSQELLGRYVPGLNIGPFSWLNCMQLMCLLSAAAAGVTKHFPGLRVLAKA